MFWILLVPCCCCGKVPGLRRRQNTAYVDDDLNWVFACNKCYQEEIVPHWIDMWDEYNRGRL